MSDFSQDVPNLPGFRSNKAPVRMRPQNFTIVNGMVTERHPPPSVEEEHSKKFLRSIERYSKIDTREKEAAITTKYLSKTATVPIAPELEYEKIVLRFFGFFQEAVHESPAEDFRVRHITILYYPEDGTIQLIEKREENSGIPQGTFLKRSRVPNIKGGGDLGPMDLQVGAEVQIFGRVIHITDADKATREWFQERGMDLESPEDSPRDAVATKRLETMQRKDYYGKEKYQQKIYMEATLGKFQRDPEALRQFLDNDRKVLRFFCVWDDSERLYGDRTPFVLNYFLADDTVEVREVKVNNSGKDPFPTLLRRQPLPRDWKNRTEALESKDPSLLVRPEDLRVGGTVNVYGRELQIQGCDAFTRAWCESKGIEQSEGKVEEDEEDEGPSLSKSRKHDLRASHDKFMLHDGEVYRFQAKLADPKPEDELRDFIIMAYPADDTVQIYENAPRNSGAWAGRFLSRRKLYNRDGSLVTAADLIPGSTVTLAAHRFYIVDADEFTKKQVPELGLDDVDAAED